MAGDIIIFTPKTPQKTLGQVMLALADKQGKDYIGFMLLQRGIITLSDYMLHINREK
jgi:hypothetical protein